MSGFYFSPFTHGKVYWRPVGSDGPWFLIGTMWSGIDRSAMHSEYRRRARGRNRR